MSFYKKKRTWLEARDIHACLKAQKRCGVSISSSDIEFIVRVIQNCCTIKQKKLTNDSTLHSLYYKGNLIHVIYDKKYKNIRTFLSDKMANDEYISDSF